MFFYRLILTAIILLSVTACGFQLRGYNRADLSQVNVLLVSSTPYAAFEKILKRRLTQSGVKSIQPEKIIQNHNKQEEIETGETELKKSQQDILKNYRLEIIEMKLTEKGISRDQSGRSNETEVTLELNFKLEKINKNNIHTDSIEIKKEGRTVSKTSRYYQDYRDPTAGRVQKKETETLLMHQMAEHLVNFFQHYTKQ